MKLGLELYKCLVRPHIEYALPAWAIMSDKSVLLLEQVQSDCLRKIMGAKAHSLDIIGNILPIRRLIRIRIRELCTREFARIMRMPKGNSVYAIISNTP